MRGFQDMDETVEGEPLRDVHGTEATDEEEPLLGLQEPEETVEEEPLREGHLEDIAEQDPKAMQPA